VAQDAAYLSGGVAVIYYPVAIPALRRVCLAHGALVPLLSEHDVSLLGGYAVLAAEAIILLRRQSSIAIVYVVLVGAGFDFIFVRRVVFLTLLGFAELRLFVR
jgi:hypothetical protein